LLAGHKFEDIYIAAGLDGIADRSVKLTVGLSNLLQMLLEGGFAVDVNRRADLGSDSSDLYIFSKQIAVFVVKIIHIVILFFK